MSGTNETLPRLITTFISQGDLQRRAATAQVRRDPLTVAIGRGKADKVAEHPAEEAAVA